MTIDIRDSTNMNVISFHGRETVNQTKPRNDLLVFELTIRNIDVERILIDTGSLANIIFKNTLERMKIDPSEIAENPSPLVFAAELKQKKSDAETTPRKKLASDKKSQEQDSAELFWQLWKAEILEEKREPTCEPVVSVCLDEAFPE